MPAKAFTDKLAEQIGYEFSASQQYIAVAAYYDFETLPRLADFFYKQAVEERNHAMMMVQYLIDLDVEFDMPGVEVPQSGFKDIVAPVALSLEQERRVSDQIAELSKIARETDDYQSGQFMQWFLQEQVEEVATMSDLLRVCQRAADSPLLVEEFIARENFGGGDEAEAGAPAAAGGAL
ncbi:MAG TPA: ferritin [Baekduia sp.]|nr:ferritin [Baekduia sp.]